MTVAALGMVLSRVVAHPAVSDGWRAPAERALARL